MFSCDSSRLSTVHSKRDKAQQDWCLVLGIVADLMKAHPNRLTVQRSPDTSGTIETSLEAGETIEEVRKT